MYLKIYFKQYLKLIDLFHILDPNSFYLFVKVIMQVIATKTWLKPSVKTRTEYNAGPSQHVMIIYMSQFSSPLMSQFTLVIYVQFLKKFNYLKCFKNRLTVWSQSLLNI